MSRSREENQEIGRATGILAVSTLISRLLGLVRNQILSHFFGASISADAFIAAFTIPNALRRLLGEGGLTPAFVSIFTRALGEDKNWRAFLSASFAWLSLLLFSLTALGIYFAPELVALYVPNFKDIPGKFELAVSLTRFLFPFMILISWAALAMGILNSFRHFLLPALGPAILNIVVIALTPALLLYFFPNNEFGIYFFSAAILLGVSLQLIIQIPTLRKFGAFPSFKFKWKDPRVFELLLLLGPSVFSLGIHQLNIIINRRFASDIPGGVSHLFYADLLVELPVSLIATSMAVAAVPSFTRLYVEGNREELGSTFCFSSGLNLLLSIPSMIGLLILGSPIISAILQTGEFTASDTSVASSALFYYALGIPFFCFLRSLLPLYFAAKDTKTPALAGFAALIANYFLARELSQSMGTPGIALATSGASILNCLILLAIVWYRFKEFPWGKTLRYLLKSVIAGGVMGAALYAAYSVVPAGLWLQSGISISKLATMLGLVALGAIIYLPLCSWMKAEPIQQVQQQIAERIFRRN